MPPDEAATPQIEHGNDRPRDPSGSQTEKLLDRLEQDFTYHGPRDAEQMALYQAIRAGAHEFARAIAVLVPVGREQSLALTNLEQTVFWANAGIARHG